jgi:hypothetical protein
MVHPVRVTLKNRLNELADHFRQRQLLGEQIAARVDKRAQDKEALEAYLRAFQDADSWNARTLQGRRDRRPEVIQKEPIGFKMQQQSE